MPPSSSEWADPAIIGWSPEDLGTLAIVSSIVPSFGAVVWALIAIVMFYVLWKVGIGMTRSLTTPLPAPPPEGELRRVNVRFRCSLCGVEIRMTMAPEADPQPPRHCMEDMDLVAPIE
jgi:hypothetical protein